MKQSYIFYVYILKCSHGTYYTGVTNNLETRLSQHVVGTSKTSYTYTRRPIKLVYSAYFNDIREAIAFEKQIKRWSKKKKEALINNDWESVSKLGKKKDLVSRFSIQKFQHKIFYSN